MSQKHFTFTSRNLIKKIGTQLFIFICLVCFTAATPHLRTPSEDPNEDLNEDTNFSIKAVIFDFGGVIADHDNTHLNSFMTTSLGITQKEYKKARTKWKKAQSKGISEKQYWEQYVAVWGKTLDDSWFKKMHQARNDTILEIPGTLAIVKELKRQGYQVGLLSNVTTEHAYLRRQTGYHDLFDPLLLSCEIGVEKPDPKAYQILLDALLLPADQVLFIDDRKDNVEEAQKMGIHAIEFKNAEQLEKDMQALGIDVSSVTSPVKS